MAGPRVSVTLTRIDRRPHSWLESRVLSRLIGPQAAVPLARFDWLDRGGALRVPRSAGWMIDSGRQLSVPAQFVHLGLLMLSNLQYCNDAGHE
jgi:hypothetical protein